VINELIMKHVAAKIKNSKKCTFSKAFQQCNWSGPALKSHYVLSGTEGSIEIVNEKYNAIGNPSETSCTWSTGTTSIQKTLCISSDQKGSHL
jgi:hypothetical protein